MASILVVDDDAHIREVARFALARAGHAVELATDGEKAYERIRRGGIELVVLDVLMPELDGFGLCRRVRADSHRGGPPEGPERAVPYLGGGESPTHAAEPPREIALADRREVRAALAGRYGSATRLWDHQERVYLFVALPVLEGDEVTAVVYVTKSTRDVKLQLFVLRTWLVRISIATLIATALITLLLSTTIARPLGRLTRRAQRIAGGRAVEERERETRRADEIGELARAVEAMTDELERRARDARTLLSLIHI